MSALASKTLGQLFSFYSNKNSQKVMITSLHQDYTFEEISEAVHSFSVYLKEDLKLKPGDRLAIVMPNIAQFYVAFWAAQLIGLVTVAINPLYTSSELVHVLNDSGAKAIVVWDARAKTLQQALPKLKKEPRVVVTKLGDMLSSPRGPLLNFICRYLKGIVPWYYIKGCDRFKKIMRKYHGKKVKPYIGSKEDLALLQYTGGTTGRSKGVMLSNSNILSNIDQVTKPYHKLGVRKHYKQLLILPLFHIYGLCISINAMFNGANTILISNPRDTQQVINILRYHKPEVMPLLNTLMVNLLKVRSFHRLDFSWLKVTITGGMATHKSVADEWKKVTGCVVNQGYGLSETSPIVSITSWSKKNKFIDTVGCPVDQTQVKVVSDSGVRVAKGHTGELWVKGPQVMMGYWRNESATKEVLKDGWFATGDIVKLSADGKITIVDRLKDMVIVSGFNVFPTEVEMALTTHPHIIEAAVVGESNLRGNESVKAYIVSSKPLTLANIRNHCKSLIAAYKVPTHVEFVAELPKSTVGKVLRKSLRSAA